MYVLFNKKADMYWTGIKFDARLSLAKKYESVDDAEYEAKKLGYNLVIRKLTTWASGKEKFLDVKDVKSVGR